MNKTQPHYLENIQYLPFSPQSISEWDVTADIVEYLTYFWSSDYVEYFINNRIEDYLQISEDFKRNAESTHPSIKAEKLVEATPDFQQDPWFGLFSKYAIAWHGLMAINLEENYFFSIPHLLEANSELECSILLASNLYYRQGLQVLRSFLEAVFVELFFCENQDSFQKWQQGNYQTPFFRGKTPPGLLRSLVNSGTISGELSHKASTLYGNLNPIVHGTEDYMIHRGVFAGKYAGHLFQYERFQEWCTVFAETVDVAIKAQYITVRKWHNIRPRGILFCESCHNKTDYFIDEKSDELGRKIRCSKCGDYMTLTP